MLQVQIAICAYHNVRHLSDIRALLGRGDLLERDLGEINGLGLPSTQTVWITNLGTKPEEDAIDKAADWLEVRRADVERLSMDGWEIRITLDLTASGPVSSVVLTNRFLSQLVDHKYVEFEVSVFPQT